MLLQFGVSIPLNNSAIKTPLYFIFRLRNNMKGKIISEVTRGSSSMGCDSNFAP